MFVKTLALSTLALTTYAVAQDAPATAPQEETAAPVELAPATEETESLTLEAVDELTTVAFNAADEDADGELTQEEFVTMTASVQIIPESETEEAEMTSAAEYLVAKFEAIAKDQETISKDDIEKAVYDDFAAADLDGDMRLEGNEISEFDARRTGQPL